MRIAIMGAAGKAGALIAREALSRGHDITGFGRSAKPGVDVVKDALDLTAEDLADVDVVVDALGFFTPENLDLHTTAALHLADLLAGADARLLIVGGAGSLYVDAERTTPLLETSDFPDAFVPLARAQAAQLAASRERTDAAWTFISPAADFQADGEREGGYVLAGDLLETGADGTSRISYADYAIAVVDEAERAEHVGEWISVHAA